MLVPVEDITKPMTMIDREQVTEDSIPKAQMSHNNLLEQVISRIKTSKGKDIVVEAEVSDLRQKSSVQLFFVIE